MYIEGSNHQYKGLPTYLVSPVVTKSICFTFWYHMHVVGDPKLNLYVKYEDGQEKIIPVWGMEGDQGNVWNQGVVPMVYNGKSLRVSLKTCSAPLELEVWNTDMFHHYHSKPYKLCAPYHVKRKARLCVPMWRLVSINNIAIGHVNEYPTMHYFENPRHTQPMICFQGKRSEVRFGYKNAVGSIFECKIFTLIINWKLWNFKHEQGNTWILKRN